MVGVMGLALDVGHMFIVKAELQAFADSAAVAACTRLNGTKDGVDAAEAIATVGPLSSNRNTVNFSSQVLAASNITTGYRKNFSDSDASYGTASGSPGGYDLISVTATAPVNMNFIPIISSSIAMSYDMTATAIAGQKATPGASNGMVPFSPDAHDPNDSNFGFTIGEKYSLRWGNGNKTDCTGDKKVGFDPDNEPPNHGFVNLGWQGNSNAVVKDAITWSTYPKKTITVDDYLYNDPGNGGASDRNALAERSGQDPEQTASWQAYLNSTTRNNRRIVIAPVNDPANRCTDGKKNCPTSSVSGNNLNNGNGAVYDIIGFGAFLLEPETTINGYPSSGSMCAIYLGPASAFGGAGGTAPSSTVSVVLYK